MRTTARRSSAVLDAGPASSAGLPSLKLPSGPSSVPPSGSQLALVVAPRKSSAGFIGASDGRRDSLSNAAGTHGDANAAGTSIINYTASSGLGRRRGSAGGLGDIAHRGSLAAAVSTAHTNKKARARDDLETRDAGWGIDGAGGDKQKRRRAGKLGAAGQSEEEKLLAIRKEAMRRYLEGKKKEVAAKLQALARVEPLTTRYHNLLCKLRDGHHLGVYSVHYADDGNIVASASHDGTAICWDILRAEVKRTYRGHSGPVFQCRWAPTGDNDRLLTASEDGCAKVWDKRTGDCLYTFRDHDGPVSTAVWCSDGSMVATAGADRDIYVYDMEVVGDIMAKGGQGFVVGSIVDDDRILVKIGGYPDAVDGHVGPIRKLLWVRGDEQIISCSDDCKIKVWQVADAGVSGKLLRVLHGHAGPVNDVNASPDFSQLVTASSDGTAKVWNFATGQVIRTLRGHVGVVYAAVFTAEGSGRRIITGGHDRTVCVWDAGTGILFQRMAKIHLSWVLGLDVRVDGLQFVTAAGDRTVGVWRSLPTSTLQQATGCLMDSGRKMFWKAFGGGTVTEQSSNGRNSLNGKPVKVLPVPLKSGGGVL